MLLSLAWRNIWRNKRRSIISISSVFFAVLLAIGMRSMQLGFYGHSVDNVVSFFNGYIQIHAPKHWDTKSLDYGFVLSDSLIATVEATPYVTSYAPRLESFGLISSGDATDPSQIIGIDPELETTLTGLEKRVKKGEYLRADSEGIMLGTELANHLEVDVGDTVVVLGQGYHGMTAAGQYEIEAVIEFPLDEMNAMLAYITLPEAQKLTGAENMLTSVALSIKDPRFLDLVEGNLNTSLSASYDVLGWKKMLPELDEYITVDNASGIIMLILIYMVVGFGILGTILMMTMERTRELGMLMAVGMKRRMMGTMVVIESILLTLIGAVVGSIVSIPILVYLHFNPIHLSGDYAEAVQNYGFEAILPFSLDPSIFYWQTITVIIIALIAAFYPVWKITHLAPVTAMRQG